MKIIKLLILSIASLLIMQGWAQKIKSTNFEILKMDEGIYAAIHKSGGHAICNVGIVDLGDKTVIFDTFLSPFVAEELLEVVKKLKLSPVKYVINSHYHNDHIRGNQVFADDVIIISTRKTRDMIIKEEPGQIQKDSVYAKKEFARLDSIKNISKPKDFRKSRNLMEWYGYYEALVQTTPILKTRLPEVTFDHEMYINGTERFIKLLSLGKGHSIDDLILIVPDAGIAFTGDLVFTNMHPYMTDSYPEYWMNNVTLLKHIGISRIVPGHGPLGNRDNIEKMIQYIAVIEEQAITMYREGLTFEDLEPLTIPEPFNNWWFEEYFKMNLTFYLEKIAKDRERR